MSRSSAEPATVRPPEHPISPDGETTRDEGEPGTLGLVSATGLVLGSIVGTGVFTLPAVLAAAGTVSLLVLAVVAVGAWQRAPGGPAGAAGCRLCQGADVAWQYGQERGTDGYPVPQARAPGSSSNSTGGVAKHR